MKNELLLASLLLANPVSAMSEINFQETFSISQKINSEKLLSTFVMAELIDNTRWIKTDDGFVEFPVKDRVELQILKADYQPQYWDNELSTYVDVEMDFEIQFTYRNAADPTDTTGTDTTFFAKKIGENLYRLWDCESSANCRSDEYMEYSIYDSPEGKVFKVRKAWTGRDSEYYELGRFKKNQILLEKK